MGTLPTTLKPAQKGISIKKPSQKGGLPDTNECIYCDTSLEYSTVYHCDKSAVDDYIMTIETNKIHI